MRDSNERSAASEFVTVTIILAFGALLLCGPLGALLGISGLHALYTLLVLFALLDIAAFARARNRRRAP